MNCGICGENKSKRTISGIPMCEDCFAKLSLLRNNDIKTIIFFQDESNMIYASKEAKAYIHAILQEKQETIRELDELKEKQRQLEQLEVEKINYAKSFNEFYEYDVVTVINKDHGTIDEQKMMKILADHAKNGWKLHTIYSNELGKNALSLLGLGVNSTASEDVLIFERRIPQIG